ncbi:hypothetical protein EVAR_74294_1 [Eumeta japonica]|uniref:Uncharacterized protein n=1 Tax=Eumeta variegata TaxID=151549 RepID=A0A4C1SCW2_EUMVA|nr:hypothetical protein EVAR_74294_1 [Eumeta japonica]
MQTTRELVMTAAHGHSQHPRCNQYVAGLLSRDRIFEVSRPLKDGAGDGSRVWSDGVSSGGSLRLLPLVKGESIFEPGDTRSGRTPRPRSTLTSARPRVNQGERAAKLRSILQCSEEVTDDWQFICLNEHWIPGAVPKFEIRLLRRNHANRFSLERSSQMGSLEMETSGKKLIYESENGGSALMARKSSSIGRSRTVGRNSETQKNVCVVASALCFI